MLENEKVTLKDLVQAHEDGEIKWRVVVATNHIAFNSFRALYKGRLYIMEASGRLTCWNSRNDALIWFDTKADSLYNRIINN